MAIQLRRLNRTPAHELTPYKHTHMQSHVVVCVKCLETGCGRVSFVPGIQLDNALFHKPLGAYFARMHVNQSTDKGQIKQDRQWAR